MSNNGSGKKRAATSCLLMIGSRDANKVREQKSSDLWRRRSCGGDVQRSQVTILFWDLHGFALSSLQSRVEAASSPSPCRVLAGSEALSYGHPWFTSSSSRQAHEAARHHY